MTAVTKSAPSTTRRSGCSNATHPQPHTATADKSRTYITHLVEFGYPEKFVQDQVGHSYASTTAIYTHVSDEYRTRLIRNALTKRDLWEDTK
jgi:site-specific recombinase XerD